jgi:hypothetical protein
MKTVSLYSLTPYSCTSKLVWLSVCAWPQLSHFGYSSYSQDPPFAKAFTYVWVSTAAFGVVLAFPRLVRSLRNGRFIAGVQGIREDDLSGMAYEPLHVVEKQSTSSASSSALREHRSPLRGWMTALASWTLYSPPRLRLDIGQRKYPHTHTLLRFLANS